MIELNSMYYCAWWLVVSFVLRYRLPRL